MIKYISRSILLWLIVLFMLSINAISQTGYQYKVDLTTVAKDQLSVELICPTITSAHIIFYLPKIVPGTYMNSNYGKYVQNLQATDKQGKQLSVRKTDDNSWEISDANSLYKIKYQVEDTWDAEIKNKVYPMAGTNFEAGKNFVINTCGLFGYFDGMKKLPFEISFTKPLNFYGATGLKPISTSPSTDVFRCLSVDELYDSPIMFSLPDTTTIKVGNTDVLIAVYSPNKLASSSFIATNFEKLIQGAMNYLGGRLPVDKYAFLFYFNGEQKPFEDGGAWEHSYSSFYSLDEEPEQSAINNWIDIAAHEFFHIVTPLTISSKEVKEFNYNETKLSKHLWLYEGSTEYYAHHMQVRNGIKSQQEFIETLADKINYSRTYFNDSLSFTDLSKESAGKWKDQYPNVYLKGALISACLDLYLLKLSGEQYSFRNLKHDLGVRFGKNRYFDDDALFDEIESLTYPEIKTFLTMYVDGSIPIPYEKYFVLAGIDYLAKQVTKVFSVGGISIRPDSNGRLFINTDNMNDFGKKMGYKNGDELININGTPVNANNLSETLRSFYKSATEGGQLSVSVNRKLTKKKTGLVTLSAPVEKVDKVLSHTLTLAEHPTGEQLKLRSIWLGDCIAVEK